MKDKIKLSFNIRQDGKYPLTNMAKVILKIKCKGAMAEEIYKDIERVLAKRILTK